MSMSIETSLNLTKGVEFQALNSLLMFIGLDKV